MKHTKDFEILRKARMSGGWITIRFTHGGYTWYAQAQVFDAPSRWGLGWDRRDILTDEERFTVFSAQDEPDDLPQSARISRLSISDNLKAWGSEGHEVYNYDRGLDFDNTTSGLLDTAIRFVLQAAK